MALSVEKGERRLSMAGEDLDNRIQKERPQFEAELLRDGECYRPRENGGK